MLFLLFVSYFLSLWDASHLAMVYNPLYMLLNSVLTKNTNFVKDFSICIHKSVVCSFLVKSSSGVGIRR